MTWPTTNISTANLDNDADSPLAARPDLKAAVDNLNEMRSHVTPFATGLLDDADAVEARATLGLGSAAEANTGTGPTNVILGNDARLANSREWTAATVDQAEAETGTATTRRAWTAQRVRQAIAAWWESARGALLIRGDGNIALSGSGSGNVTLYNKKNLSGVFATGYCEYKVSEIEPGVLTAYGDRTLLTPLAGATITSLFHYQASQGALGAGASIQDQYGFSAHNSLTGAVNNYGFFGNIEAGTGRWNFYAGGTAANYFAGNVTANAAFNQTPARSAAGSGSAVTLTTSTNHLLYDQAATVAALTITLPSASLTNGQTITIATRSAITSLTINGGTIYGAPTTLAAGGFCSFIYSSAANAWFRRG